MRDSWKLLVLSAALAASSCLASAQSIPPGGGTVLPPLPPPGGGMGAAPFPGGFGGGRGGGGGGLPGGAGGRGSGGGAGGSLPKSKAKSVHGTERFEAWDVWWELNDDAFLSARAREHASTATSNASDALLGGGDRLPVVRVTKSDLRNDIEPVLRRATKDPYLPARKLAVVALGKTADANQTAVYETIRALVGDTDWDMRASACVGLGMLGDGAGVPLLLSVLKNDLTARQFSGVAGDLSVKERAFAAIGVGLVGLDNGLNPEAVDELRAAVRGKATHPDLRVFPALALGALRVQAAAPDLKAVGFDADAPEVVRAHAIVALGKLGEKGSVSVLVREGLADRSAHVQRSAAIALGLLTDREDQRTVDALIQAARSAADRPVRNFAMIALGQIGNRAGRDVLVQQLRQGNVADRTFGAMALGVFGAKVVESRQEIGRELLAAFAEARTEGERAAFAIALGLADVKSAAGPIQAQLASSAAPELRGHLATALGLLGARAAVPALQEIVQKSQDAGLLMKAAVALGLIGDPGVVKILLKVFEDSGKGMPALVGAALAIGFVGDRSAVAPLAAVLDAKGGASREYARAYAALALGILGDKRDARTLAAIQENANYLAPTEYLSELLSTY